LLIIDISVLFQMGTNKAVIFGGVITAIIIVGILASPLFYETEVDESLDLALSEIKSGMTYDGFVKMDDEERKPLAKKMSEELKQDIMDKAASSQSVVSKQVDDMIMSQAESKEIQTILEGQFVGLAGHEVQGTAKILQVEDATFLRFEDFQVTNGPDLRVYITPDGDVSRGIQLDKLHGSKGNQNYILENIDVEMYDTVVIYCQPFGVYFAKANLTEMN